MKFSSKVKKCGLSPMRKFHPYAVAAEAKGRKIYHLNIGQPDVETPPQFFEAVRNFSQSVLGKNFEKMEGTGCSLSQIDRPWHKMRKGTVIKRSESRAFDLAAKIE